MNHEHPTYRTPPSERTYRCCGGFGEHFDWCGCSCATRRGCTLPGPEHAPRPRDNKVPCQAPGPNCEGMTWAADAVCDTCHATAPVICRMSAPDAPHTTSEPGGVCLSCKAVLAQVELGVRS